MPKKSYQDDTSNCKLISVLGVMSKLFEIIVHRHLYSLIANKITSQQHGIMKARSATTNLVNMLSCVAATVEKMGKVGTVYFDFLRLSTHSTQYSAS